MFITLKKNYLMNFGLNLRLQNKIGIIIYNKWIIIILLVKNTFRDSQWNKNKTKWNYAVIVTN